MKSEMTCLYTECKKEIDIPKYIDTDDYEGEMLCPECDTRLFVKFKGSLKPNKYRLVEKPPPKPTQINYIVDSEETIEKMQRIGERTRKSA